MASSQSNCSKASKKGRRGKGGGKACIDGSARRWGGGGVYGGSANVRAATLRSPLGPQAKAPPTCSERSACTLAQLSNSWIRTCTENKKFVMDPQQRGSVGWLPHCDPNRTTPGLHARHEHTGRASRSPQQTAPAPVLPPCGHPSAAHSPHSCRWAGCGSRGRAALRGPPASSPGCPQSGRARAGCEARRAGGGKRVCDGGQAVCEGGVNEAGAAAPSRCQRCAASAGQGHQAPPPAACRLEPLVPQAAPQQSWQRRQAQPTPQLVLGSRKLAHDLGPRLPQLAVRHLRAGGVALTRRFFLHRASKQWASWHRAATAPART